VWRARARLPVYAGAVAHLDFAVRNTRVLCRRAVAATRSPGPAPAGVADAIDLLAGSVEELMRHIDEPERESACRRLALEAAVRATSVLDDQGGLQTTTLVAQIRSTAVDLLRSSGLSEDEALDALEDALRDPSEPAVEADAPRRAARGPGVG
jgi:hypothetical protein